jgi:hypothetical protein
VRRASHKPGAAPHHACAAAAADTYIHTPKTREELSYLIGVRPPSGGGGAAGGRCLHLATMNWWTMEFVVVDVGATLVLLVGYLALVLRKAVL